MPSTRIVPILILFKISTMINDSYVFMINNKGRQFSLKLRSNIWRTIDGRIRKVNPGNKMTIERQLFPFSYAIVKLIAMAVRKR